MTVLMYHKRFAPPILAGTKTQTIRPYRKRPIKVGELLNHRVWEAVAYRSAQINLLDAPCIATIPVHVELHGIALGESTLCTEAINHHWLDEFAKADGFKDWFEMRQWYIVPGIGYGLPFHGVLIQWGDK